MSTRYYRVKGSGRGPNTDPAAAVLNQLTATLTARAGTRQMPVLITPENWCIADTTPILALLDGRMVRDEDLLQLPPLDTALVA